MSLMKYKLRKFGKLIGINFSLKDMNKPQTVLFYLLLISGLLIPNTSKADVKLPAMLKKPINIAADHWDDATESNN